MTEIIKLLIGLYLGNIFRNNFTICGSEILLQQYCILRVKCNNKENNKVCTLEEDIYHIPTKEEYESDQYYYNTQYGRKKPTLYTHNMPTIPIDPQALSQKVLFYLKEFGNEVSDKTEGQIESFCKLFNFCIDANAKSSNSRYVHAAQTGSAKSLSLKVYVSLLQTHSSLIVVSKVDEALEYCAFINELKGDNDYARCYYSVTDKNKESPLRAEKKNLQKYQCIVISHAMFQKTNQNDTFDLYRLYQKKQRDLVVIDEKVSFYESTILKLSEVKKAYGVLAKMVDSDTQVLEFLESIIDMYVLEEEDAISLGDVFHRIESKHYEDRFLDSDNQSDNLKLLIQKKFKQIAEELFTLGRVKSDSLFQFAINNAMELVKSISIIIKDISEDGLATNFYKTNYEQIFFQVSNIVNKLGASVILDATANINNYYKVAYIHDAGLYNIYAEPIRKYSNLRIHKAKGYKQGRSTIYNSLEKKEIVENARMYISYALNELYSDDDKMLIIAHKNFKSYLLHVCNDQRIVFTHWGNHVGKNDWSDCNKVMIIGWNFISAQEHIFTAFNAIDNDKKASSITKNVLNDFSNTQLADDMIQGIMRCHARKIDTLDGDCKKTDVYLFYSDTKSYNDVLDIVEAQFPECAVVPWQPNGIPKKVKATKRTKIADVIINYLAQMEHDNKDVMFKDVIQALNLKAYQHSRVISDEYFIQQLALKGYKIKNSDGKSKYFILK